MSKNGNRGNIHIIFYDQLFGRRRDSVPIIIRKCWIPQQHPGKILFHEETTAAFIRRHRIKHIFDDISEVPRKLVSGNTVYVFRPADTPVFDAIEKWKMKIGVDIEYMDNPGFMIKNVKYTGTGKRRLWYRFGDFYRIFRKQTGILMQRNPHGGDDIPVGGKWSFDSENRQKITDTSIIPHLPSKPPQQTSIIPHLPKSAEPFYKILPRDRNGALKWLQKFIAERLKYFGKYQDAIVRGEIGVLLFHSGISALLNVGLLRPLEVVEAILKVKSARMSLENVKNIEAFIRQLVWREFMHCVYVHFGKDKLLSMNYFSSRGDVPREWYFPDKLDNILPANIPDGFYSGRPDVYRHPVNETIRRAHRHAYLHHIERLMVIGNAMSLLGIHPVAAYDWFIRVVAIDSYEWVMVGNILMCMFNDGGKIVARKPYLATTNYILKMSNWKKSEIDKKWIEEVKKQYHEKIKRVGKFWH